MRTVIGLAGVKTSGKSTVAEMIKKIVGNYQPVTESALADKLKNTCSEVFEIPREYFDRQDLKEVPFEDGPKLLSIIKITNILNAFGIVVTQDLANKYQESGVAGMILETPRRIAQIVGTEVLRATGDENIHCNNVPISEDGITIISDLRFPNEYDFFAKGNVSDAKFLPLYIQRDEAEVHVTEDSHPSEKLVFDFSHKCKKVSNNSTLQDLEKIVLDILLQEGLVTSQYLAKSKGA